MAVVLRIVPPHVVHIIIVPNQQRMVNVFTSLRELGPVDGGCRVHATFEQVAVDEDPIAVCQLFQIPIDRLERFAVRVQITDDEPLNRLVHIH